jgi:nitrate reductase delta subunit
MSMAATYKVLSAALSYPTAELQAAVHDLVVALNTERLLSAQHRAALGLLLADLAEGDLLDLQAAYVDLFDRTRVLSLHMFEHVHGESRDRGQAMVSLRDRYRAAGFDIAANELPDYIPMFLEFLSLQPLARAQAQLAEAVHILCVLGERLTKRQSRYAAVFEALAALASAKPDAQALDTLREVQLDDPRDFAALDRAWEEAEVRFGPDDPGAAQCPKASEMLRRMDHKATTISPAGGQ